MTQFTPLLAPLFVPATKTDRIERAANSGADAIIVDLEDAVAPADKVAAWQALEPALKDLPVPVYVRINAIGSPWFADDLAFAKQAPIAGVMLPKTQSAADLAQLGPDMMAIGLVETAAGIAALSDICTAPNLRQLAFGSIDLSLDLGCVESREALLLSRLNLVLQSRAHNLPAPIDGVTVSTTDVNLIADDTEYAMRLGFGGKLSIHPKQLAPIQQAFRPSAQDTDWAKRVLEVAAKSSAAFLLDGQMIDAPVVKRAERIVARNRAFA